MGGVTMRKRALKGEIVDLLRQRIVRRPEQAGRMAMDLARCLMARMALAELQAWAERERKREEEDAATVVQE